MKDIDYTYAVASVRSRENEISSKNVLERLVSEDGAEASDYDNILTDAWEYLSAIAPDKTELEFMIVRNDFHNFKAVTKALMAGIDGRKYCIGPSIVDVDFLNDAIRKKNFDSLPEWISETARSGYELLTSTSDGRLFDMFVDKAALETMQSLAPNNDFCRRLANETAVLANIKIAKRMPRDDENLLRYAFAECDGINTEELAEAVLRGTVDSYAENAGYSESAAESPETEKRITRLIDEADFVNFGIEPLVAYYYKRAEEQSKLRLIARAKRAGYSQEEIKKRL